MMMMIIIIMGHVLYRGLSGGLGRRRGKERTVRGEEDGSVLIYTYEDSLMKPTKH
jgi:hypothetical protein